MVRGKFENVILISADGSTSGVRAVINSLLPYWNMQNEKERNNYPKIDIIDNIDPDEINGLTNIRDFKKSLFLTSSQYGLSPATMSVFMIAKRHLEYELGENYRLHMVACTKNGTGILNQLANQEGHKTFTIPDNISYAFSFLSPSGILPLALVGIDINEFLSGVKDATDNAKNPDIYSNNAAKLALIHYLLCTQKNKKCSVLMPYSTRINSIPDWCMHIHTDAFSHGVDIDGKIVNTEQITNVAKNFADKHAVGQMLLNGRNNKTVTILRVENFDTDNVIPQFFDYTSLGYLGGKTLSELMDSEINAVKMLLNDNQRPNITVNIPQITPYNIGYFMGYYMSKIIIQARLYNIEPHVHTDSESFFNYIYAQLGKFGYEATYQEMKSRLEQYKAMT